MVIKAIQIYANGGPEVLRWEDVELGPPGPGEVQIRHTAIAVNFSDINVRRGGFYITKPLKFPVILGNEAAGVVQQIGAGDTRFKPGQRVAYAGTGGPFYENTGAYAEARNVPASCLVELPAEVSDRQAAAVLMKGLTASMIIHRVFKPKEGQAILIHGAAGGVGLLLCQWSKHLGATVLGTVGSHEKAEVCRAHGCDHPILYREVDFVSVVRERVPGGVAAVFDGVGRDTFEKSLNCIRPFGMIVNYGNASGHPPPIDLILLARKGSLSVSRPGVSHYQADPGVMSKACAELFDLIRRGVLRIELRNTYALGDAAQAHRDLEERRSIGAVMLLP
jgi:NADPH2:quinone reductase